jgi:uroporphyrinogen decarboxylase
MTEISSKSLLNVLRREKSERRPAWFMRQAGRYLPEYREVRAKAGSFLDLCYHSSLAAEVTLQPLRRYDLDAAIIFADILVVPHAMGNGLDFKEGEGPVLERVRSGEDMKRLGSLAETRQVEAVCNSIRLVRKQLATHVAMIGFCGAPWTVASYMLEGGGSDRQFALQTAYLAPAWFIDLLDRLVEQSVVYLRAQIDAGAEVVQIFDSWAGDLSGELFDRYSVEPMRRMVTELRKSHPDVPVIAFARGAGVRHARLAREVGCQAIGIEQEAELQVLLPNLPAETVVQGNLDPIVLLAGDAAIGRATQRLAEAVPRERHIFNLGHGIKQQTPPEALTKALETLRQVDGG